MQPLLLREHGACRPWQRCLAATRWSSACLQKSKRNLGARGIYVIVQRYCIPGSWTRCTHGLSVQLVCSGTALQHHAVHAHCSCQDLMLSLCCLNPSNPSAVYANSSYGRLLLRQCVRGVQPLTSSSFDASVRTIIMTL